jgi:hypothetical protein
MDGKLLLKTIEHFDKLGAPINVGDYVAYPHVNSLQIGLVIKLNPKMVKVKPVTKKRKNSYSQLRAKEVGINRYPVDCILVGGELVTLYVLKNA